MGANPPKPKPRYPYFERKKHVLKNLLEIISSVEFGVDLTSISELPAHDHALIDHTKGVGGYQLNVGGKMKVLIEHQGLKKYRIRYSTPDFWFPKVIREVHCNYDELAKTLEQEWKRLKPSEQQDR